MTTLQDRLALATGSSRGIGAAIATLFANEGARLEVHGPEAAVETVRKQIAVAGGQALSCIADLTHYVEIEEVRERITMSYAAAPRPTASSPIAYAAAKAGIELVTKGVAAQAGPYGVRVNCNAPETIHTLANLHQGATKRDPRARDLLRRRRRRDGH